MVILLATLLDFSLTGYIGFLMDETALRDYQRRFADGGIINGLELTRILVFLYSLSVVISRYYQLG